MKAFIAHFLLCQSCSSLPVPIYSHSCIFKYIWAQFTSVNVGECFALSCTGNGEVIFLILIFFLWLDGFYNTIVVCWISLVFDIHIYTSSVKHVFSSRFMILRKDFNSIHNRSSFTMDLPQNFIRFLMCQSSWLWLQSIIRYISVIMDCDVLLLVMSLILYILCLIIKCKIGTICVLPSG